MSAPEPTLAQETSKLLGTAVLAWIGIAVDAALVLAVHVYVVRPVTGGPSFSYWDVCLVLLALYAVAGGLRGRGRVPA